MGDNVSLAKARGRARRYAMQAVYQWQMTGDDVRDIREQFLDEHASAGMDQEYFIELLSGVAGDTELDAIAEQYMSRAMESVDPVERAILRIACYEFKHRLDVPYRVVLDEAIRLTKQFCSEKSHKFVNAVLDKVARELRKLETAAT